MFHTTLLFMQHVVSFLGIFIIFSGVLYAVYQYFNFILNRRWHMSNLNYIRLILGDVILLGLEFIVAADLIATTTTPDYYSLGLAVIIVLIRTLLSYSLSKEVNSLSGKISEK